MEYNKKDIPKFQNEVCKSTCVMNGRCIDDGKDDHWYFMCPHYFNWKLGYVSFTAEQLKYQREHPEEQEEEHKRNVELAKKLKKDKKAKK